MCPPAGPKSQLDGSPAGPTKRLDLSEPQVFKSQNYSWAQAALFLLFSIAHTSWSDYPTQSHQILG